MKKRENNYIDFHTHTTASDGFLLPAELVNEAYHAGIHTLAITDHNTCTDVTALKSTFPEMELIQGCEFSCHAVINGKKMELHIVGLDFDPKHPAIQKILHQNSGDRQAYIQTILEKLRAVGIDIGTYGELRDRYPDTVHLGRMHIAQRMAELGFVHDADEAFDRYIGAFGHRLAYVEDSGINYASMEEVINAIHTADDGVAVLAHLFYYQADDNDELAHQFKLAGGDAIEVYYPTYTKDQEAEAKKLAEKYELLASGGSDYHRGCYANLHYMCTELLSQLRFKQNCRLIVNELFRERPNTVSWWNFSETDGYFEHIADLFQVYNPNETGDDSDA